MKRKFIGMTNSEYIYADKHIGLDGNKKITMPCKDYKLLDVYCGLSALCAFALTEKHCTACFDKPVKKANGHYVLKEVKQNGN